MRASTADKPVACDARAGCYTLPALGTHPASPFCTMASALSTPIPDDSAAALQSSSVASNFVPAQTSGDSAHRFYRDPTTQSCFFGNSALDSRASAVSSQETTYLAETRVQVRIRQDVPCLQRLRTHTHRQPHRKRRLDGDGRVAERIRQPGWCWGIQATQPGAKRSVCSWDGGWSLSFTVVVGLSHNFLPSKSRWTLELGKGICYSTSS
jgi:hypothetical protein